VKTKRSLLQLMDRGMPSFPEMVDDVQSDETMAEETSTPLRHVLRLHSRRLQIFQVAAGPQRREAPSST
jgi:hypothetical protein